MVSEKRVSSRGNKSILYFSKIFIFSILLPNISILAQVNDPDLNVLPKDFSKKGPDEMLRKYLRELSYQAFEKRSAKYESLKTLQQIRCYQTEIKQFFLSQLNLPEKKTDLNPKVSHFKRYKNYQIEKIIYESQPGFYVSALLYLPVTKPPYPGVLVLCGHEESGKAAYQKICIDLARNGMAALCPDPIGQGERKQILDKNGNGLYRATTEHLIEGIAPILLGRSLATYMIWDGIRAIDYLVSRSDIDSSRIGCTGNSGGGNRTSYLMALDERVTCAAPSCFITTTRWKNEASGPGDAEQNIHAQLSFGLDIPDYILMRAPKPTLILSATQDFIPIEGAWQAFREAKRFYTRLSYPERVDMVETDSTHGFSKNLRTGAVRWMRRWLLGIDDAVSENNMVVEKPEDLLCFSKGQTLFLPGAKSIFDLNVETEFLFQQRRKKFQDNTGREEKVKKIRYISGVKDFAKLPPVKVLEKGRINKEKYLIKKLILQADSNIQIPALLFQPQTPSNQYLLYFHEEGKNTAAYNGEIEKIVKAGGTVLAADLRGIGETQTTPWRYIDAHPFTGHDVAEFFIAYTLDKSFLGMRADDILVCAKYIVDLFPEACTEKITMISVGTTGPAALHAFILEIELFKKLILHKSLMSWLDVIKTPVTKNMLNNTLHGVLQYYDLPDLISMADSKKIIYKEPVNAQGIIYLNN